MSDLQITTEQVNGILVLRLAGDPQIIAAPEMMENLFNDTVASKPSRVVIDLTRLEYIGSLVAGRLVAMQNFLRRNGGSAVIAGPNKLVKDALTRMRVVTTIPVHDTLEQALAS